jgi:hypothetical protein
MQGSSSALIGRRSALTGATSTKRALWSFRQGASSHRDFRQHLCGCRVHVCALIHIPVALQHTITMDSKPESIPAGNPTYPIP